MVTEELQLLVWRGGQMRPDRCEEALHATLGSSGFMLQEMESLLEFLLLMFILRQRESMSRRGSEREGDTESEASSRLWFRSSPRRAPNKRTLRS